MATKEKTTMKRRHITEVYNILSQTTTEGLEGNNVTMMLVTTSKLRRVVEVTESLIKGIDEQRPKELKDLTELPKDDYSKNRILLLQNKWNGQKDNAINTIIDEDVDIDTHFLEQADVLKFLEKQSGLKTTEKATLLDWLSK